MAGMSAPFGGMPTRWDPESGPSTSVAVIAPGAGYSPSHPLHEFARQSLVNHGWSVQQIWWDKPDDLADEEYAAWVCDQVRATLHTVQDARRAMIVAKSLGTLSSPVAAQYGLDATWLTPLFDDPPSIDAISAAAAAGARQLLVGGLADPSWDPVRARALGCEVVDFEDVTHFFHVPGDAVRSAQVHVDVTRAIDAFLEKLDRAGAGDGAASSRLHNFGFVLDGRLAGMAHPGYGGGLGEALDELRDLGFTAIVSLDEEGLSPQVVQEHGLTYRHIPVADFHPPTNGQADAFVRFVDEQLAQDGQVVAHCQAGIGRTGTMLASYLISTGLSADDAVTAVRRRNPHSVESDDQRAFLDQYAERR
jgi:protein tyrosine phosphatase (PTP) superfamily phosphohydrolase (DUF442 family)